MQRDDSELTGSMSDLWVIFEIPSEEGNDDEEEPGFDDDYISLLGQSFSDLSLCSSLPEKSFHQNSRHSGVKSPYKRIDRLSLLLRMNSGSTNSCGLDPSMDETDSTTSCSTSASSICYYSGDRWSPCTSPKKISNTLALPRVPFRQPATNLGSSGCSSSSFDKSPRRPIRTLCTEELPTVSL